jgi:hypothetical protein
MTIASKIIRVISIIKQSGTEMGDRGQWMAIAPLLIAPLLI